MSRIVRAIGHRIGGRARHRIDRLIGHRIDRLIGHRIDRSVGDGVAGRMGNLSGNLARVGNHALCPMEGGNNTVAGREARQRDGGLPCAARIFPKASPESICGGESPPLRRLPISARTPAPATWSSRRRSPG